MSLKLIGEDDIHSITSGQVITELKSVVKELVENSLDANATTIQVTFKKFGLEGIEIVDNGDGIDEKDFENLCLKNYTSKLENFDDLGNVKTLGFRGEALNSICSVSDVSISTAVGSTAPRGWELVYDKSGKLTNKKLVNQSKGTVVKVTNIFHNLPVRKLNLEKNYKKEFQTCINMLTTYLVILTNYRIIVHNFDAAGRKKLVLKTSGNENIRDNIINVFGSSGLSGLANFDESFHLDDVTRVRVSGLVSKVSIGDGRLTKDRQFVYINRRPVVFKRFNKVLNEGYKKFNSLQKPVFVLNIEIDESLIDVNVTPDKGIVLLSTKYENFLLHMLDSKMEDFWESGGTLCIPVDHYASQNVISQRSTGMRQVTLESYALSQEFTSEEYQNEKYISEQENDVEPVQEPELNNDLNEKLEDGEFLNAFVDENPIRNVVTSSSYIEDSETDVDFAQKPNLELNKSFSNRSRSFTQDISHSNITMDSETNVAKGDNMIENPFEPDGGLSESLISQIDDDLILPKVESSTFSNQLPDFNIESIKVRIHLDHLHFECYDKNKSTKVCSENKLRERDFLDKELSENLLGLSIHKNDFNNMKIVGQFNKGFIIVYKKDTDDILIVDQHASDEKFNFEKLIDQTTFESQPLVIPQKLDLSSIEKLTILGNTEKFTKNGFKFKRVNSESQLGEASGTEDLYLTTLPYSKSTIFNVDDLNELIQLVESTGNMNTIPRPSKVRSMFAMRACRSSIMVGQTLSKSKMEEVVQNLSNLDKPWNCPHGRPTMRHIVNIDQWNPFNSDYLL